MRNFSFEEKLLKIMSKLYKRDRITHEALMKKIQEILTCDDIAHYKNLRRPMQAFKRVHINGPFVLIFKYIEEENKILFYDFDHHDNIYLFSE